jgi:hypothetical protein
VTGEDQPHRIDHLPPRGRTRRLGDRTELGRADAALGRYFAESPKDFLAVATPGAGKTTFALTVACRCCRGASSTG